MINLSIKFEVSVFAHYEDMKRNANVEIGVIWSGSWSSKIICNNTVR